MFKKFCQDPNYLTKYNLLVAGILLGCNAALVLFHPPAWTVVLWYLPAILLMTSTELKVVMVAVAYAWMVSLFAFEFSLWSLAAVIPAILLTFPFTSWIHSPAHGIIKPKWFNRLLGEAMGLIQLTGFPEWTILHVFHHSHSDDPKLDPHAPLKKTYWEFAFGMRAQISKCFMHHYFHYFGETDTSKKRLKQFMKASRLNMFMKVSFWYLVFGPQLFSFFFLSSILFKMLHYSWFNHATHRMDANGDYVIINLDRLFYRWINFTASGLYYHGNHHARPNNHNPQKISLPKAKQAS